MSGGSGQAVAGQRGGLMKIPVIAGCVAVAVGLSAAQAQQYEYEKIIPTDGHWRDTFGQSVGISGTTAVIGAPGHGFHTEEFPGAAYIFDTTTGEQRLKFYPGDGAVGDRFGGAVAIDGNIAIGGSTWHDNQRGAAYLFDATTGAQLAKLRATDGAWYDIFGGAVALSGSVAVVGAVRDGDNGPNSGSAYLFRVPTGGQLAKLLPNDGVEGDFFGWAVAVDGPLAVVGALLRDDNGSSSGAAYLFDTASGQQLGKLLADDGAPGDKFGYSVSIDGNMVLVGASGAYYDNGTDGGAAYLFDVTDPASPVQTAKLLPDPRIRGGQFGCSAAISGGWAVVGSWGADDNGYDSGVAYLFDISDPYAPIETTKLLASEGDAYDKLGFSVAIDGSTIVAGAPDDHVYDDLSGSAYLFSTDACSPDLTGDGIVNTQDFIAFLNAWANGDPVADWNDDGVIDTRDFIAYLNAWATGC